MLYRAIARRGTMLHIAALRELLLDYICTCSSLVIIINADWLIKRHTEDCMAVLSFPIITLTTGICTMLVTILINRILHPHHHSAGLRAAAELWVLMITLWDAARHWRQHSYLPTSSVLYRSKKTTTMFWIKNYHQRWRLHRHITCCVNTAHTAYLHC